ncbi:sensor histidine kinase [Rosistilla oblonga]|uniref:sensor histidine kinase n=1 Tax=Rosistilla oblonga TaxID=2527990 RepID=UPI003A980510
MAISSKRNLARDLSVDGRPQPAHDSPSRSLPQSIAWRLQMWHAAILVSVVVGLCTAWFLQARRARLNEIDAELTSAARVLDGSLRGFDLRGFDTTERPISELLAADDHLRLSLPRELADRRDNQPEPYFGIWLEDGRQLKSERLPEGFSLKPSETEPESPERDGPHAILREVRIVGPAGSLILVGRDIGREIAELNRLAVRIAAFALLILAAGLCGGWWLARSVLRPIAAISDAASRFSAADMSPRINVVETESELGQLATILNDAFDRVERSFDQQRQFAADASHELRTPLAVIQSQIELALKRERTSEEYVKTLTTCSSASERLSDLVESLLTLARLDFSSQPTEHTSVRVDLVAARCIDLMRPVAQQAEVNLRSKLEPAIVSGDPKQIERVIFNLLKNSVAYNRRHGEAVLSVAIVDSSVELILRDNGIGISEADLAHVAERFYRADKARSRVHGGSGLGLSIAQGIVERHGGTMQIASQLDQGTMVTVHLPLASNRPRDSVKEPVDLISDNSTTARHTGTDPLR